jgi:hypothetical protein
VRADKVRRRSTVLASFPIGIEEVLEISGVPAGHRRQGRVLAGASSVTASITATAPSAAGRRRGGHRERPGRTARGEGPEQLAVPQLMLNCGPRAGKNGVGDIHQDNRHAVAQCHCRDAGAHDASAEDNEPITLRISSQQTSAALSSPTLVSVGKSTYRSGMSSATSGS